ncbi:MAG: ATP-binding protein [Gemmatimonadaceae bacterium]
MTATFGPYLVALSTLIAVAALYTGLALAGRASPSVGLHTRVRLAAAAFVMGLGICGAYLVATLAFGLPVPTWYARLFGVLFSAGVSFGGLRLVSRASTKAVESAMRASEASIRERENAVRDSEAALRSQEAFLRQIINTNPNFVFVKDWDGVFIQANVAMARMYGTTPENVIGKKVDDFIANKEQVREFLEEDRTVMREGQTKSITEEAVIDISTGRTRWFQTIKIPLIVPGTSERRVLGVATDITERKQLEDQLRQSQKMESLGQLTGGIAHDLNNLFTVILANSGLIAKSVEGLNQDLRSDFADIQRAAGRGAEMVRKLLAFSRRETLTQLPLQLEVSCGDTVNTLRRILPATIDVRLTATQSIPAIRADSGALEQILINLATNARDAMPLGGMLSLDISAKVIDDEWCASHGWGKSGNYVCLSVSDNGSGMDATTREKIFEPFFTTKRQGEGTGLGLPMVYGLMRQHDGYISVYTEVGTGTTIRLYFPAIRERVLVRTPISVPAIRGGRETILVADDEEAIRRSITRVLERHGYHVVTAANGAEAMNIMRERGDTINLVISDVVMPVMGGREFYAELKEIEHPVRFIFTSGYAAREISESVHLDPNVPFLHKPWTMSDLLVKVREVFDTPAAGVATL